MRSHAPEMLFICSPRMNQLQILSMLAEDPNLTQAVLARSCGLSVAMVNNYMKELCDAGLIEYRRKSSKSVSYHLTGAGRAQIAAIESEFTGDAIDRFAQAKERLRKRILSQSPIRSVVLYGGGHLAQLVFHALEQTGVNVVGVCDENPGAGRKWCGCSVLDISQIASKAPDAIIITDWRRTDEIWQRLKDMINGNIRLIRLDGQPSNGASLALAHS